MSARRPLRIALSGGFGHGVVELGGHAIQNEVSAIDLHTRAGQPTTATLELFALPVDLEADVEVRLPEETQALLKRLGWTPPEEAS